MAPRASKTTEAPPSWRQEEWNGITRGDPVHVRTYGERGATWRFLYARERDGRPTEVTVFGGAKDYGSVRTFTEDRIQKLTKKIVATRRKDAVA